MRFLCENCKSKYTIGDNKIRNRVLKIRCRKCGGIIEIHDPDLTTTRLDLARAAAGYGRHVGADEKPAERKVATAPPPEAIEKKEVDLVHWFVGITGSPFGPISARVVHSNREEERIDDESLVWREGMPEWIPLRTCKELIGLLAAIDIEQAFAGEMSDLSVKGANAPQRPTPVQEAPEGFASNLSIEIPDSPAKDVGGMLLEFEDLDQAEQVNFDQSQEVIRAVVEKQRRRSDSKFLKVMVGGFFLVAVAVFVYVVFIYKTPPQEKEIVEKVVYRDRLVEVPVPGGPASPAVGQKTEREDVASNKRRRPSSKKGKDGKNGKDGRVSGDKVKQLMAQMGGEGTARDVQLGSGPSNDAKGASGRKTSLAESDISRVVNKNKPRLKICYERALRNKEAPDDKDVRVNVAFTVGASGLVKGLQLTGSAARISSLEQCLSKALSRWVFPASAAQSAPVEFPVLFTPK